MTVLTDLTADVRAALNTVRDPELDEPVTDLGFVTAIEVTGPDVQVRLRLPTYFCAPNFAYLMVADARDAVAAVPGVGRVRILLEDHFAGDEINAGVAADAGFTGSFPGEARDELDDLRATFVRKAHTAALDRACRYLLAHGWTHETLPAARLGDLPAAERDALVRRRGAVGLGADPGALVLVGADGVPVPPDQVSGTLRFARTVRVSIDGNAGLCRGLLRVRYGGTQGDGQLPGEDGRS
jgi:metal-sulfur cluster biosynthetic enzyme